MDENELSSTDVTISATDDSCANAKVEPSSNITLGTNICLNLPAQLKANANQKEIAVRITSKSKVSKLKDINTF